MGRMEGACEAGKMTEILKHLKLQHLVRLRQTEEKGTYEDKDSEKIIEEKRGKGNWKRCPTILWNDAFQKLDVKHE